MERRGAAGAAIELLAVRTDRAARGNLSLPGHPRGEGGGVGRMLRPVDRGAEKAESHLRGFCDRLDPPALGLGKVPDADEHRPERGDEVNVGTVPVPRRDRLGDRWARRLPDEEIGRRPWLAQLDPLDEGALPNLKKEGRAEGEVEVGAPDRLVVHPHASLGDQALGLGPARDEA